MGCWLGLRDPSGPVRTGATNQSSYPIRMIMHVSGVQPFGNLHGRFARRSSPCVQRIWRSSDPNIQAIGTGDFGGIIDGACLFHLLCRAGLLLSCSTPYGRVFGGRLSTIVSASRVNGSSITPKHPASCRPTRVQVDFPAIGSSIITL